MNKLEENEWHIKNSLANLGVHGAEAFEIYEQLSFNHKLNWSVKNILKYIKTVVQFRYD